MALTVRVPADSERSLLGPANPRHDTQESPTSLFASEYGSSLNCVQLEKVLSAQCHAVSGGMELSAKLLDLVPPRTQVSLCAFTCQATCP